MIFSDDDDDDNDDDDDDREERFPMKLADWTVRGIATLRQRICKYITFGAISYSKFCVNRLDEFTSRRIVQLADVQRRSLFPIQPVSVLVFHCFATF